MEEAINISGSAGRQNSRVILFRILVFLFAGTAALLIDSNNKFNVLLSFSQLKHFNLSFIVLCVLMFFLPHCAANYNNNASEYPQLKYARWNAPQYLLNVSTWTLYLFSYEYFLRGAFLQFLLHHLNATYAILVNVSVYTLLHLHKSKKEMLMSVPYGFLLCLIVMQGNSFYPAFILHLLFAVNYEWACVRMNSFNPRKLT